MIKLFSVKASVRNEDLESTASPRLVADGWLRRRSKRKTQLLPVGSSNRAQESYAYRKVQQALLLTAAHQTDTERMEWPTVVLWQISQS